MLRMLLGCWVEVHICSSGRMLALAKLDHESKRRGQCVHETVASLLCVGTMEGTSCVVESEIPQNREFPPSFYLFVACSIAQ